MRFSDRIDTNSTNFWLVQIHQRVELVVASKFEPDSFLLYLRSNEPIFGRNSDKISENDIRFHIPKHIR